MNRQTLQWEIRESDRVLKRWIELQLNALWVFNSRDEVLLAEVVEVLLLVYSHRSNPVHHNFVRITRQSWRPKEMTNFLYGRLKQNELIGTRVAACSVTPVKSSLENVCLTKFRPYERSCVRKRKNRQTRSFLSIFNPKNHQETLQKVWECDFIELPKIMTHIQSFWRPLVDWKEIQVLQQVK